MWSTYKVYDPLHMQWMGIWNHRQPVTIALVDPDFDGPLGSLLGYKPYHYAVIETPYPSKAACTSMRSRYKVYEPLHMQWMGIWNHRQPVTIALVVPDFDSRLKAWVTLLGYKPYHYAVVEAPYLSKAAYTSIWSTYKVYEPIHMQWIGIWNHQQPVAIADVDPDFESWLTFYSWIKLLGYKPYHYAAVEARKS
jgi:hypothetical protein